VAPGQRIYRRVGYGKSHVSEKWRINLNSSARVSTRKYWEVDTNVRLTKSSNSFHLPSQWTSGRLKIDIYAQVKDMPRPRLFGIGAESKTESSLYSTIARGSSASMRPSRLPATFDIGGAFETILPRIIFIKIRRAIRRAGIQRRQPLPASRRQQCFCALRRLRACTPAATRITQVDYKFFLNFFQDTQEHRYSFRRLTLISSTSFLREERRE